MPSAINGVNHITLSVLDLNKAIDFYQNVLGCQLQVKWDAGAYLTAGDLWLCLGLDNKTRTAPLLEYTHIAFHVAPENFAALATKIKQAGAVIWKQNTREGDSLYFLDPDHHKLEIHTTDLATRLASCKAAPYAGMAFSTT